MKQQSMVEYLMTGSSLEDINKIKDRSSFADHKWSEASWRASTEDWYIANGSLRHDILIFGKTVPKTYVQTHFEQVCGDNHLCKLCLKFQRI